MHCFNSELLTFMMTFQYNDYLLSQAFCIAFFYTVTANSLLKPKRARNMHFITSIAFCCSPPMGLLGHASNLVVGHVFRLITVQINLMNQPGVYQ